VEVGFATLITCACFMDDPPCVTHAARWNVRTRCLRAPANSLQMGPRHALRNPKLSLE